MGVRETGLHFSKGLQSLCQAPGPELGSVEASLFSWQLPSQRGPRCHEIERKDQAGEIHSSSGRRSWSCSGRIRSKAMIAAAQLFGTLSQTRKFACHLSPVRGSGQPGAPSVGICFQPWPPPLDRCVTLNSHWILLSLGFRIWVIGIMMFTARLR